MIRKLQIKFVAMCMILVTAVLGVVFTAVFFSAKQNIEVISHQVLQRVMEDDTPSGRPDLGLNRGGEDVLLPYFTVNLWDRSGIYEAFVTGGTYSNLQDTQELQTILTDCLQQNRPEGTIHSYGLRYLRRDYGLYERIAFVDMSMEQATLQEIMGSYLQIGLAHHNVSRCMGFWEHVFNLFTGSNIPVRNIMLFHLFFPFRLQTFPFTDTLHNGESLPVFQALIDKINHDIISGTDTSGNGCCTGFNQILRIP